MSFTQQQLWSLWLFFQGLPWPLKVVLALVALGIVLHRCLTDVSKVIDQVTRLLNVWAAYVREKQERLRRHRRQRRKQQGKARRTRQQQQTPEMVAHQRREW